MEPATDIRPATPADARELADIYNHYVLNTHITFDEQPLSESDMEERLARALAGTLPWLVASNQDELVGYAYAAPWKARVGYRYSAELTVYVSKVHIGQGLGRLLYNSLLSEVGSRGIHSVIAGIALPNDASVALHERLGFQKVAHFIDVGWKLGRWIDIAYWQKILDGRPPVRPRVA